MSESLTQSPKDLTWDKVVDVAIKGPVIAEATLMGRYAKKGSKR